MTERMMDVAGIAVAVGLVILNGFFVAAEFALVKVRVSQVEKLVREGRLFSKMALWLAVRLDTSLSACQLGITMASLALGWVGEPAFADLISPLFKMMGIDSEQLLHGLAFVIAFSLITSLHLVIGEQVPKIFAIRRPQMILLWCAAPMMFFYYLLFPFMILLSAVTSYLLRRLGIEGSSGHDAPHTEEEIRVLLSEAHLHGDLSRSEHSLLNAVFEFDDMICRRIMLPRNDVEVFDASWPFSRCLELAARTKHTRYPLCDGSLDKVLGVVHMKDLIGLAADDADVDLRSLMRPAHKVPEHMPISRLLRHFQATHQLLALVVDEYGTISGVVTLENVLEEIVGPLEDEFDTEEPNIVPDGDRQYIVLGSTHVGEVERELGLELDDDDVDTISGLLVSHSQKLPAVGDRIELPGVFADILEVDHERATRIRLTLGQPPPDAPKPPPKE
jgi:CBS domain containing-hemolysin-like protein